MSQQTTQPKFDPYKILGAARNDTLADIKKKYYKLVKKYHPDRNQGDDRKITIVTKAYNILSDPALRREYDSTYSAGHTDLREAYKNYESFQTKHSDVTVRQQFSKGDLKSFNSQFETRRVKDPNDRGYGGDDYVRLTKKDVDAQGGSRRDTIAAPRNLFADGQFDPSLFNRMFEQVNESTSIANTAMMERNDEDVSGFSLLGGSDYSEIAVYNGAIIDREVNDFSKLDARNSLNYTDYQTGYSNQTSDKFDQSTLGELRGKKDMFADSPLTESEMKRLYSERMNEYSKPIIDIPKDERKRRWKEDEWRLEEQNANRIRMEQEMNKEVVFKYKDQYPEHLLSDLKLRDYPSTDNNIDPRENPYNTNGGGGGMLFQPKQQQNQMMNQQHQMINQQSGGRYVQNDRFNQDVNIRHDDRYIPQDFNVQRPSQGGKIDPNDGRVGRSYEDLMQQRRMF